MTKPEQRAFSITCIRAFLYGDVGIMAWMERERSKCVQKGLLSFVLSKGVRERRMFVDVVEQN